MNKKHLKRNKINAESIINLDLIRTPQIIFLPGHEGCDVLYSLTKNETRENLLKLSKMSGQCSAQRSGQKSVQSGQRYGQGSDRWSGQRSGIGSVQSGPRSAQLSGQWSEQRLGHGSVPSCHGSVRSGQCSVESQFYLANSGQILFGLAKGGQSLYGLAITYLRVCLVWPMHVLGMVGLANACLGSRTSSWEFK